MAILDLQEVYSRRVQTKAIHYLLADIELYFVYPPDIIFEWLNLTATSDLDWDHLSGTSLFLSFLTIIRSGVPNIISTAVVEIMNRLTLDAPKLKMLLNATVSIANWQLDLSGFKAREVMQSASPKSALQTLILHVF